MRKYILLLTLWLLTGLAMQVSAQLINVNPDPNGEPWWAGGYEITPEMQAEYDALPPLILTQKAISTVLPYKVDNSKKKYFRTRCAFSLNLLSVYSWACCKRIC